MCRHRRDRSVLTVGHVIQRRYIHTLDLRCGTQERRLVVSLLFVFFVQLHHFEVDLFPFSEEKDIHEIAQRLGVADTGTACHHQRPRLVALLRTQRNAREIQHRQHGGIAHFILQRKADEIKISQRIAAFQRKQRHAFLPHHLLHIRIGCKHALAPHIGFPIEQSVEYFHSEMRHTHLVQIREAKRKPNRHVVFVLDHTVQFTARIACRLLCTRKQRFQFFIHFFIPALSIKR